MSGVFGVSLLYFAPVSVDDGVYFGEQFVTCVGVVLCCVCLVVCMRLIDVYLPHLHPGAPPEETEGVKTTWHRSMLLISAITLHNIPEGLAVGVVLW